MDDFTAIDFAAIKAADTHEDHDLKTRFKIAYGEASRDYWQGFLNWRLWTYLAVADIRRRYRRTFIGPFWTTLNLAIFILTMGLLFSTLWKSDAKTFLPYFASSFICWTFTAAIISESCTVFTSAEGLLKQLSLPYSSFSWLIVARNFLVFLHQVVIYICVAIFFHVPVTLNILFIIPGFMLLFVSASWLGILLGLFCARYRDIQQVVASLLQISMFVTPIFWPPEQLGHGFKSYLLVNLNPLYHYISLIRQPLLGLESSALSWLVVSITTILGWIFTMFVMSQKQRNLIFWL